MGSSYDITKAIQQRSGARPQKSYLWRVGLPAINKMRFDNSDPNTSAAINGLNYRLPSYPDAQNIEFRITNVSAPFPTFDNVKENFQNTFWYQAGKNDIGQLSLTIQEYEDGQTAEYINAWLGLIINPTDGTYFPPVFSKQDIFVYRLDTMKLTITQDRYVGYFPLSISEISSDYESSGFLSYNVAFAGDGVEHTLIDSSYVAGIPDTEKVLLAEKIVNNTSFGGLGKDDWTNIATAAFGDLVGRI